MWLLFTELMEKSLLCANNRGWWHIFQQTTVSSFLWVPEPAAALSGLLLNWSIVFQILWRCNKLQNIFWKRKTILAKLWWFSRSELYYKPQLCFVRQKLENMLSFLKQLNLYWFFHNVLKDNRRLKGNDFTYDSS